ncbi:fused MFS/spermidine synthase [Micromonospora sp. 4G57]|uniref:Fused MFS/spermidine synthase n=1 Tax=Micromonospora sicca TaxID=2202420 RepID=A0ABU5JHB2_9ACTN|nr:MULTISPECIES: fused MFS/spermidine synthase [unclassified Micromonospora]MDZ5447516.1 fused MFS/spermidine synthase [Micromonospora sp. 4G57]MDZ5492013.1 fused MFS/spermidine synthase [Micromonospora sp. 4G53]
MESDADDLALVVDPARRTGRTLLAAGVAQSYVDVVDPRHLHFEYVRRMAAVIDLAAPPGRPLTALHLGGGALTLPRWLAATRPGSAQLVVERDPAVVDLVRRELPPPPPEVAVVVADARDALTAAPPGRYDLVLADVYRAARMPGHVASVEFAAEVARALHPDGVYLVNVTDLPPLVFCRAQVATLRAVFADVCLVADRRMLRGRRYGNLVLAAAHRPDRLPVRRLTARVAGDPAPGGVLHGPALDAFVSGARPATDATLAAD